MYHAAVATMDRVPTVGEYVKTPIIKTVHAVIDGTIHSITGYDSLRVERVVIDTDVVQIDRNGLPIITQTEVLVYLGSE